MNMHPYSAPITLRGDDLLAIQAALPRFMATNPGVVIAEYNIFVWQTAANIEVTFLRHDRPLRSRGGPGFMVRLDARTLSVLAEEKVQ